MPELSSYWYWLRVSARSAFPCGDDFYGLWDDLRDLFQRVGWVTSILALRMLILVTFPVSVPLLALLWRKLNARAVAAWERQRSAYLDIVTGRNIKDKERTHA